ncbi:50S ribosomal protein L10 [Candidatus Nomurabacteria bacterium]|uniref:Large ribosomal subunit protein uL10 n=1 Tax=candidate division WWE3 bacterium TaxID=2053526 RepID=A0A955IWA1_UNCKA|nr:50S ribosomal protein L10 [candidate division WWE3 bacterium]MCB9823619.1 50S ribosomal protein L10 [Candidatus Nomurabacteria bacterium]MCB9827414.1 50S ribosomal protein L10 [Candidatus Nomurabacteria bacterium]HXK52956.1 50S ribosomal protein L10 [bacterium]
MPNNKNKQAVKDLSEKVAKAKSIVFVNYHGIKATEMSDLRSKLRAVDASSSVAKNTLLKIALKENNLTDSNLDTELKDGTMTIFGFADAISSIKTLFGFIKTQENSLPVVKSGFVEGKFLTANELTELNSLPSREELLSKLIWGLKSPLQGFAGATSGVQRKFIYAVSQLASKKEA